MKAVLDTNYYSYCLSEPEEAVCRLQGFNEIYLPAIVFGELYYGFFYGSRFSDNKSKLESFVNCFDVNEIQVDKEVSKIYGELNAVLRKKGKPIPANDIWIAASCLKIGGTLLTLDKHFKAIESLKTVIVS